jgi:hypothetical protein
MVALVVVGVVLLVLVLGPGAARAYTRTSSLARCDELKTRLAQLSAQGAAFTEIDPVQRELEACLQTAADAGAPVDLGSASAAACLASRDRIRAIYTEFKSTSYADIVRRDNQRGAILQLGGEMARCLERAVVDAESLASLTVVQNALASAIADSVTRSTEYRAQVNGTDRYFGSTEEAPFGKAQQEYDRVELPLRDALAKLITKRTQLTREAAAAARTPERLAAAQGKRDASRDFWAAEIAKRNAERAARAAAPPDTLR